MEKADTLDLTNHDDSSDSNPNLTDPDSSFDMNPDNESEINMLSEA